MEGNIVTLTDIFKFEQTSVDEDGIIQGDLLPTGIRPIFMQKLKVSGFELGADIFGAGVVNLGKQK